MSRTIVITGATSGIGEVAAVRLAEKGARIVMVARDKARADATLAKLRAANPGAAHAAHLADLTRVADMKRVAGEIAASEPRIDVLINNAGALFARRRETAEGFEMTFALNHLSYFVVTNLLLERLRATPGARVVSTASAAHQSGRLDWGDLQAKKHYVSFPVYGTTKLENILFTRELAARLAGTGVTANCLHPGFVATRFGDNNGGLTRLGIGIAKRFSAITPEEGAKTIVYLAASPEVEGRSGGYYYKCAPAKPSLAARDDEAARRLWEMSAELTGVGS